MVKVPKDQRIGRRVVFRDRRGRFVAESERYQRATRVYRQFRGKYHEVWTGKQLTPKKLANLLPRPEFEELAPNFSAERTLVPRNKHFTAWDLSQQVNRLRGLRGHMVRVTMVLRDGKQARKITFFRRAKRKGNMAYGFFRQANVAIGMEGGYLYNRIGSKFFPDRKGKRVRLVSFNVSTEM